MLEQILLLRGHVTHEVPIAIGVFENLPAFYDFFNTSVQKFQLDLGIFFQLVELLNFEGDYWD